MLHNLDLYQKKIELLNSSLFQECEYHFDFDFYGTHFKIYDSSQNLEQLLKRFYPNDWFQKSSSAPIEVFIKNTSHIKDWDHESSPDVFTEKDIVIQRDFALKIVSPKRCELLIPFDYMDGFYNFLRFIMPNLLLKSDKLLLHSGAVKFKDLAYIFLGHSGAGKSTTCLNAKKISGVEIINDDMNIVDLNQHSVAPAGMGGMFKPDFHHMHTPTKIAGIFWLQKSAENSLDEKSPAFISSKILASSVGIDWRAINNGDESNFIDRVYSLENKVNSGILKLNKGSDFWNLIL